MKSVLLLAMVLSTQLATGQLLSGEKKYSRQDSLRGSITPGRIWWDLQKYELSVAVYPDSKSISGTNKILYKVLSPGQTLQIDLQAPMTLDKVTQDGKLLPVEHDGAAHFIKLRKAQQPGEINEIVIEFSGKPREAKNAPWDGGFTWSKDMSGKDFIATSCQGIGASLWWPCKDHMYDEPDNGMTIAVNVPQGLTAVSNGRLVKEKSERNKTRTFTWQVLNPINNYGVNINVGDYTRFGEKYQGEKGTLDMEYWVLRPNLEKAKEQFKQAPQMMKALEYWLGPYPFYEDGYKLVEVPYLGMEHQSSVTYGNDYKNGYRGRDLSATGWGMKFDFIIVHESGHEWFANNITYKDAAEMWIHEGFTMYSECLFVEYYHGKKAGAEYARGLRRNISNQEPLISDYGVNSEGPADIYYKGCNILHTLRQFVNDDEKWRDVLRGMNKEFYHQTVSTSQIESYIAKQVNLNLQPFFDQYLRDIRIPVLEYWIKDGSLAYRWSNCIPSFNMPVKVYLDGNELMLYPTTSEKVEQLSVPVKALTVDPDFYVSSLNIIGK